MGFFFQSSRKTGNHPGPLLIVQLRKQTSQVTCPRPHSKLHEFRVPGPGLSWPVSKKWKVDCENNEWLDFMHSLRKRLLIAVLAKAIYYTKQGKVPLRAPWREPARLSSGWLAHMAALRMGWPFPSVQLQLVWMGVILVWNKKKRSLKRAFVTNKNGILQPGSTLLSFPNRRQLIVSTWFPGGAIFMICFLTFHPNHIPLWLTQLLLI